MGHRLASHTPHYLVMNSLVIFSAFLAVGMAAPDAAVVGGHTSVSQPLSAPHLIHNPPTPKIIAAPLLLMLVLLVLDMLDMVLVLDMLDMVFLDMVLVDTSLPSVMPLLLVDTPLSANLSLLLT